MNLDFFNSTKSNFASTFLRDLQNCFAKKHSADLLKTLPWHTILTFAKMDGNSLVCFDYNEKKTYYMPKENIVGNMPAIGDPLKIYSPGNFYVDTTGIVAQENMIEDYLKECTIAK